VASLQRIIVPQELQISRITSPTADSALRERQLLQASFQIRTYVKPQPLPAAPGDSAAARSGQ
jgi:hypothetical protein